MRRLILFGLLAGILAFSLAGCGGGGGGNAGDTLNDVEKTKLLSIVDPGGEEEVVWAKSIEYYLGIVFGLGEIGGDEEGGELSAAPHLGTAINKGYGTDDPWSGPDAGGWYTNTTSDGVVTSTARFRYFKASRRLEFQSWDIYSESEESGVNSHYVFNVDPLEALELDSVYPESFSVYFYDKLPDDDNPDVITETGFRLTGTEMELKKLTSSSAIIPAIMIGNIKMYYRSDVEMLIFSVSSSVDDASSDTPTLIVTGSKLTDDGDYEPFNETFELYGVLE